MLNRLKKILNKDWLKRGKNWTYVFWNSFDLCAMDRVSEELSGGGEEAPEEEDGQGQLVVKGEVEAVDPDFVQMQKTLARFENH